MANYDALKTAIRAAIKANGRKEITGNILQSILVSLVDTVNTTKVDPQTLASVVDGLVASIATKATPEEARTIAESIVAAFDAQRIVPLAADVALAKSDSQHAKEVSEEAKGIADAMDGRVTTLESKTEGITKVTYPSGEYETKIDGINIHDLKGTADGAKQKADNLEAWKDVFVSEDFAEVQGNLAGVQGEVADLRNDKADKSELASVEGKAQTAENLANSAGELASQTAGSLATLTSEVNNTEDWVFTLEDGSEVTKKVRIKG